MPTLLKEGGVTSGLVGFGSKPGIGFTWGNDCPLHTWQQYPGASFPASLIGFGLYVAGSTGFGISTIPIGGIAMSAASDDDYHTFGGSSMYDTTNGGTGSSVIVGPSGNDMNVGAGTLNPIPFMWGGNALRVWIGAIGGGSTGLGLQSLTGVGFSPDIVLFLGNDVTGVSGNNLRWHVGCMDAAGNQWVESVDGITGSGPPGVGGIYGEIKRYSEFRTDSCILALREDTAGAGRNRSVFHSMDPDGFTVNNVEVNPNQGATFVVCLKVLDPTKGFIQAGTLTQGDSGVSGMPLPPGGVYFCGDSWSPTLDTPDGFFGMASNRAVVCQGGTDGITQRSSLGGAGKANSAPKDYYDDASITFGLTDGNIITGRAVSTLTSGGFNLSWTTDDGGVRPFGYIAFNIPNKGNPSFNNFTPV